MAVPFGFSVGDIIAGVKLICTSLEALKESGGAEVSHRGLEVELKSLESALHRADKLELDAGLGLEKVALQEAINQCRGTVSTFWSKTEKYHRYLQPQTATSSSCGTQIPNPTSGNNSLASHTSSSCIWNGAKKSWYKVKWATLKKDDLADFRAEIRGHTSSITIMLLSMQLKLVRLESASREMHRVELLNTLSSLRTQMCDESETSKIRDADGKAERQRLLDKIQHMSREIETLAQMESDNNRTWTALSLSMSKICAGIYGMLTIISGTVASSAEQGRQLLCTSVAVVQGNLKILARLQALEALLLSIPGQVDRTDLLFFIDPFNKGSWIDLNMIDSSDALIAVLTIKFNALGEDAGLLAQRKFVVQDTATHVTLDIDKPWKGLFCAGQKVAMDMVIHEAIATTTCPRCKTDNANATFEDTTCERCGAVYYRVEEVEDEGELEDLDAAAPAGGSADGSYDDRSKLARESGAASSGQVTAFRRLRILSPSLNSAQMPFSALEAPNEAHGGPRSEVAIRIADLRIRLRNVVYITGLRPKIPSDRCAELMSSKDYFGAYGEIIKVAVAPKTGYTSVAGVPVNVHVTFARKDDASACIEAMNNTIIEGSRTQARYGTTKYCPAYIRGKACSNRNCMFLHEQGDAYETFHRWPGAENDSDVEDTLVI